MHSCYALVDLLSWIGFIWCACICFALSALFVARTHARVAAPAPHCAAATSLVFAQRRSFSLIALARRASKTASCAGSFPRRHISIAKQAGRRQDRDGSVVDVVDGHAGAAPRHKRVRLLLLPALFWRGTHGDIMSRDRSGRAAFI